MAELIEFETERLHLRQWKSADREPFAALNSDPRVMEFFPCPLNRAESDRMAERCESLRLRHDGLIALGFRQVEILAPELLKLRANG